MPKTQAIAASEREQRLFVGRERELDVFRSWLTLASDTPEILFISGPGGMGKSSLLTGLRPGRGGAGPRGQI